MFHCLDRVRDATWMMPSITADRGVNTNTATIPVAMGPTRGRGTGGPAACALLLAACQQESA